MRVLTLCAMGHNRSVTAKWLLMHDGHEVIAAGVSNLSAATLSMLYAWADRIVLLDKCLLNSAMPKDKLVDWDVGRDRFPTHLNPELLGLLRRLKELRPV